MQQNEIINKDEEIIEYIAYLKTPSGRRVQVLESVWNEETEEFELHFSEARTAEEYDKIVQEEASAIAPRTFWQKLGL